MRSEASFYFSFHVIKESIQFSKQRLRGGDCAVGVGTDSRESYFLDFIGRMKHSAEKSKQK